MSRRPVLTLICERASGVLFKNSMARATPSFTTHYLEEAEQLCNRVGFLKKGRLVSVQDTSSLLASSSLEQAFRRILAEAA